MEKQHKERATVTIAGTKYFVDLLNEKLLPEEKGLSAINLETFEVIMEEGWIYVGYYDLDKRRAVEYPDDIKTMPEGKVVEIVLPSFRDLDPPSWYERYADQQSVSREIIEGKPIHHTAFIIPLEKSDLAIRVQENNISLNDDPSLQSKVVVSDYQDRVLPEIVIEGTRFLVDVMKEELREKENETNVIAFKDMEYRSTHYLLDYDRDKRNVTDGFGNVSWAYRIEHMATLDPEGMALKTSKTVAEIKGKNDFELLVDQDILDRRLKGQLPVIEICGHPFYVDLRMGCIRPKDDFSTEGIRFREIAYEGTPDGKHYQFPYDPERREPSAIDLSEITELPKGIVLLEIPTEPYLDPVSYARLGGWNLQHILLEHKIQDKMLARVIPWEKTGIERVIKENRARKNQQDVEEPPGQKKKSRIKRGRGI